MNFKFFPQTKEEIEQMLKQAGMNSLDDLYADVKLIMSNWLTELSSSSQSFCLRSFSVFL